MSTKKHADQHQFAAWAEKAARMSCAELNWSIADALAAAKAMQGHDPIAENWYMDEAFTYADERRRRAGRSANPTFSMDDFDFFDDGSHTEAADLDAYRRAVGGEPTILPATKVLRLPPSTRLGKEVDRVYAITRTSRDGAPSWFVATSFDASDDLAGKLYKGLIPRTKVDTSTPHLHDLPLYLYSSKIGDVVRFESPLRKRNQPVHLSPLQKELDTAEKDLRSFVHARKRVDVPKLVPYVGQEYAELLSKAASGYATPDQMQDATDLLDNVYAGLLSYMADLENELRRTGRFLGHTGATYRAVAQQKKRPPRV